jgi:hypothetical protein
MSITLRPAKPGDAAACGRICYEAFKAIATQHNFPPDFPSADVAVGLLTMMLGNAGIYGVVAERAGRIVGSNFVDERSVIAGIGLFLVLHRCRPLYSGCRTFGNAAARTADRGGVPACGILGPLSDTFPLTRPCGSVYPRHRCGIGAVLARSDRHALRHIGR